MEYFDINFFKEQPINKVLIEKRSEYTKFVKLQKELDLKYSRKGAGYVYIRHGH